MRPVIRSLYGPDVPDLTIFEPDDPTTFGFLLTIVAGPDEGPGEEKFDVVVCSPKWFEHQLNDHEVRSGRHHLMMRHWDWASLEADINRRDRMCAGDTWTEAAAKLGRLGQWEFEEYTPYSRSSDSDG